MSLRFRRSIRIAPGLRLNVGLRGLSATVGPRGASLNIGPRGIYSNLGIPGTGISSRQRLSGGADRQTARDSYRGSMKELRELERSNALASASAEHDAAEQRLASLRGILSTRNRGAYDWQAAWGSKGDFCPAGFREPTPLFSHPQSEAAAARMHPIAPWIAVYIACGALAILLGSTAIRMLTIPFAGLVLFWLISTLKTRGALARTDFQNKSLEFEDDISHLKAEHEADQQKASTEWVQAETARENIRTAIEREDLPTIVSVLESELQNEPLPVPLVFELELDSTRDTKIEVTLPELDDIPSQVTALTQRGKLSTKAMSQRDHTDLFADLCAGIALRLLYEAFRVVPSLLRIEVFGTTSGIDPATGHSREFIALALNTSRAAIDALNLDNVDPTSALVALGGRLSCDKRGVLSPIAGVVGITGNN
jgi:Protein of unknown function (DUF4236)